MSGTNWRSTHFGAGVTFSHLIRHRLRVSLARCATTEWIARVNFRDSLARPASIERHAEPESFFLLLRYPPPAPERKIGTQHRPRKARVLFLRAIMIIDRDRPEYVFEYRTGDQFSQSAFAVAVTPPPVRR
jgi:hypothetical protein